MNTKEVRRAIAVEQLDAWARHAHAANGFGDADVLPTQTSTRTVMPMAPRNTAAVGLRLVTTLVVDQWQENRDELCERTD